MDDMARPIGEALPAIVEHGTHATASSDTSTIRFSDLDVTVLDRLPARLSDTLLGKLEVIANCPLPAETSCSEDHFNQVMRSLSILPRRSDDEVTGRLRAGLYHRMLAGFSNAALSHLCEQALATCKFFPTISECMALLQGFDNRALAKLAREKARNALRREKQTRMEETMDALARGLLDGDAIAELPEWWRKVAETRALVWNDGDGKYRPRPNRDLIRAIEGSQPSMDL